ncbi:MAG: hypothetical protein ABSG99_02495 [Sedimentisphaerales bacterium]
MKPQKYLISSFFVAVLFLLLLMSSSTYAAVFQVKRGTFVAQNDPRWLEVIPAEDMDAHAVTWSANNVRFFPSWQWQNPKPGDQLCWLYDSPTVQIWWNSGRFNRLSTDVWVQLNGCDQNDGDAEIYVDGALICTVNTHNNPGTAIAILITKLPLARHTVEIRTKTNGTGDVSIDYVALPRHGGGGGGGGWDCQEHFVNMTGLWAYDLTKVLLGHWIITNAIHSPFTHHVSFQFGGFTIIHWWGGAVPPGGQAAACFNTLGGQTPPARVAFWTDSCGHIIGLAGAVFHVSPRLNAGNLEVAVAHTWRNWNAGTGDIAFLPTETVGPGYPPQSTIDVNNFYYALVDTAYDLNDLDPNFVPNHPGITWTEIATPFTLTANDPDLEEEVFNLGPIGDFDANKVMIIRAESEVPITYPGGTELVRSREMVQFPIANLLLKEEETPGDVTGDGYINFRDVAAVAENWLRCSELNDPNCFTYFPDP